MANLEELKARLVAVIEANKAEDKRFEPVKTLQAAAEKFKTAKDKAAAKKEIKKQFERLPTTQQLGMPPFNIKTDIIRGATTIDIFWDNFSE